MFFPFGDDNVKGGFKPIFSYSLIVANVLIFLLQNATVGNLVCEYATIPGDILNGKGYYTLITSMFLHGGWMHLLGNMMFLWIFADNIEATVGNLKFILFYIAGGLAATFLQIYFSVGTEILEPCCYVCGSDPCAFDGSSQLKACAGFIPSLGASGAISAVMGAYLVMFPKSKIKAILLVWRITLPAFLFLIGWFGQQLLSGIGSLGPLNAQSGGVAWWAHIGGFVFGVAMGFLWKNQAQFFEEEEGLI